MGNTVAEDGVPSSLVPCHRYLSDHLISDNQILLDPLGRRGWSLG